MRLIDADELRKCVIPCEIHNGASTDLCIPLYQIDNAPTIEMPKALGTVDENGNIKIELIRPQGEWISVNERLPEDMQRVLIWFEYFRYGDFNCMYQTYGFGYVCDGKWSPFINGETGWQDYKVIAWQPLPEPYKKGGAE